MVGEMNKNGLFLEELGGKGETLIFVHGLGGSTNTWYPQAQVLKRDLRLIAYDLAGSGRSPVRDGISIASHVADLLDVVRRFAAQGQVHLAGHSLGTIICQHLAAAHPDLVASLILAGPFPEPPEAARAALRERAAKARAEGMRGIADAIVAGGTSDDTKVNQPAVAAFVRESLMAQPPEGYARNCEALAEARSADLSRIACPTLLLTGDQDRTAPPDVGRAMASAIRDARFQLLTGCGHWTTIERAKQVNYASTAFHARLNRPHYEFPLRPAGEVPGFSP
jgi:pimeloyl-ACP methyl ester carboxylesterase